jgi:predicted secreted acid phosphatase
MGRINRSLAALLAGTALLWAAGAQCAPANLFELKDALRQYVSSNGYESDIRTQDGDAQAYLDSHLSGVQKPAIVLDIDETSLSNMEEMEADDFAYLPGWSCQATTPLGFCSALAWDALERATAIAPTLALFNDARAKGVKVFFITGRRKAEEDVTAGNLRKAGYDGWERLIMRPDRDNFPTAEAYKTEQRRELVEVEHYDIIVNVGDQMSDLNGGYAQHPVKLPNPFYFIR